MDKRKGKRLLKAAYKKWHKCIFVDGGEYSYGASAYLCDCIGWAQNDLGQDYAWTAKEFFAIIKDRIGGAFGVPQHLGKVIKLSDETPYSNMSEEVIVFRKALWKELFAIVGETSWNP